MLCLAFLVRLVGITNPPLETGHNWRQTTVTMVARNFYEVDAHPFYPRVDFAGDKTGITGMEFPLLNYSIYLTSKVFGYQHWYGRLINLLISSFGLFFFFLILKRLFNEKLAYASTVILLFSIWFTFSRKIMPDTFSMSFVLGSLYFCISFFDDKRNGHIFWYGLLLLLGVLAKIPSGYLLVATIPFLGMRNYSVSQKLLFVGVSIVALIPAAIWYFYWVPHLTSEFGFSHFFMGKSFLEGITELMGDVPEFLAKFYEDALGYVGFGQFAIGAVFAMKRKQRKLLFILASCFACYSVLIAKAGYTFSHQNYYMVPLAPVMALAAGYLVSLMPKWAYAVLLLTVVTEVSLNGIHDFEIRAKYAEVAELERELDHLGVKRADLIAINSHPNPTPMYFSHRKGWLATNQELQNTEFVQDLKSRGLVYVVVLKKVFGSNTDLPFNKVGSFDGFDIYRP